MEKNLFEQHKNCFVICPLGEPDSTIRKRSNTIYNHILKPVLTSKKYNITRADEIPKVGFITSQIINLLIDCDLVIADLSFANPNVFYELAIRHATSKPYIQIIDKEQKIPFDISGIRTIVFDVNDLDSVEYAKREIFNQIDSFDKGHKADSPISIAKTIKLIQDDNSFAELLADKITSLDSYTDYGMCPPPSYEYGPGIEQLIERIDNKLFGFKEFSTISLEEVILKLETIISQRKD